MTAMVADFLLVGLLVLAALLTVMAARLLRAAIGLVVTSALLTALMFRLDSPMAGVFELSVCAGLIPAILITTIGMTQRLTAETLSERRKEGLRRFWYLPVIVILAGIALSQLPMPTGLAPAVVPPGPDVRQVLWGERHADLLGQIVVLLGGVFGVVVLVMEAERE
jgi:NADH-quinone oxidoreductase subunit J